MVGYFAVRKIELDFADLGPSGAVVAIVGAVSSAAGELGPASVAASADGAVA